MKYLIIVLLFFHIILLPAQNIFNSNSCGNEYNTESLQGCTNSCDNSSTSIISNPYHLPNNNTASKTVSVNFILLRDDNGQKGFDKTNAEHVKYFQDVVSLLNNRYSDLQPSTQSSPSTCEDGYLSDTKIRFSVEIVNWDESNYWDNQNSNLCPDPDPNGWYMNPLDNHLRGIGIGDNEINIYFTESAYHVNLSIGNVNPINEEPSYSSCSEYPDCDESFNQRIHIRHNYLKYLESQKLVDPSKGWYWDPSEVQPLPGNIYWWLVDGLAGGLAHELGHCFFPNVNHTNCGNNVMNSNGSSARNYMKLDDIGQMNRTLKVRNTRKYVKDCHLDEEWVIESDELIDGDFRAYSSIVITAGNSLAVSCALRLPTNTKIIVERGGKLIVDGGTITSYCDDFWTGIEVHGHADQPHQSHYVTQIENGIYPVDADDHGVVVIKNGGTIENAHVGITNVKKNNGAILTHSGGIIIAEEANFINCWKGVEMYQFRPDKAGSAANPKQNISRFTNCTFKTTSDYFHDDYPPTDFVTLWDVHDVQFEGCTFENEAYADFLVDDRGNGITSIDATYQLKGRCTAFDYSAIT